MNAEDDPLTGFEQAWKEWVQRPPETSAATAAERVVAAARASRVRRRPRWIMAAAAAAALVVAGFTAHFALRWQTEPVSTAMVAPAVAPLGSGEVLIWLDDDTPLYMTFQPPPGGTS